MRHRTLRSSIWLWLALLGLPATSWAVQEAEAQFAAAVAARPDQQLGERLFQACIACHGADGTGQRNGDVPAIAGQYPRVLIRQLVDFHFGKRWDVRMEAIAKSHPLANAQQLADVAAYVNALPRLTDPGRGDGESLAVGMRLYRSECASCHGDSGQGNEHEAIPWLAGQHYEYLLREMYYTFDHRRPNLTDHHAFMANFARADFQGVADYLSGLPPAP
jgi:cytochrome c553